MLRASSPAGGTTIVVKVLSDILPAFLGQTFLPGLGSAVRMEWDGIVWKDAGEGTLVVHNLSESTVEGGPLAFRAHLIDGEWVLDMFDLNSLRLADPDEYQIAWKGIGSSDWKLESIEDAEAGKEQVIWHPAGLQVDLRFKNLIEQEFIVDYDEAFTFTMDTLLVIDPEIATSTLDIPHKPCV